MLAISDEKRTNSWHLTDSDATRALLAKRQANAGSSDATYHATGYVRELYRTSLLTRDEERALFERMDVLKADAAELRAAPIDIHSGRSADALQEIGDEIELIRDHLVESNLRLVVSVARTFRGPTTVDFHDLISEGNAILMKAVDLFQIKYGCRFSTYATAALRRGFYTFCNTDMRRKTRFVSGQMEGFDGIEDEASEVLVGVETLNDISAALDVLDRREKKIVIDRFGLRAGAKEKTFREMGEEFNLSKERIRQIMGRALEKMRTKLNARCAAPDRN